MTSPLLPRELSRISEVVQVDSPSQAGASAAAVAGGMPAVEQQHGSAAAHAHAHNIHTMPAADAAHDEPSRCVFILYTGGTIGMKQTPRGYCPAKGHINEVMASLPQFQDPLMERGITPRSRFGRRIKYVIKEYEPLLDSSDMTMDDWVRIAREIGVQYNHYDAFIILHGTDTMAYTASALSFMLENLGKTVIVTGAQVPLSHGHSDGVDNLHGSLMIAGHYNIPEVGLFFHEKLWRGNRTSKVDASGFDAFQSGNCGPLVELGTDVRVHWDEIFFNNRVDPDEPFRVRLTLNCNVATLRLFPGIRIDVMQKFLSPPVQGLVLETYGSGNASSSPAFLDAIREATSRGIVVLNVTQCFKGRVVAAYATGTGLQEAGVVPCGDITAEAALAKLSYLLGRYPDDLARVRELAGTNIRGEMTSDVEQEFSFREASFIRSVARVMRTHDYKRIERVLLPVLMCAAAAQGNMHDLRDLIRDLGECNVSDYDGRTPLHLAVAHGQLAAVEYLLSKRARVNAVDGQGRTPLFEANRRKDAAMIALLAKHGALERASESAVLAALDGNVQSVIELLEMGADSNAREADTQRTLLHIAAERGDQELVEHLLYRTACDHEAVDADGLTARDVAESVGRDAIVALLDEAQATISRAQLHMLESEALSVVHAEAIASAAAPPAGTSSLS